MGPASKDRRIHIVAIVLAASPFLFGLMRAFSSRHDFRMLWMAFAAFLGAGAVMATGKLRGRRPTFVIARSAAALAIATLLATALACAVMTVITCPARSRIIQRLRKSRPPGLRRAASSW